MSQQIKVAEAVASLEAARAVLYSMCGEIMALLEAGILPSDEQRTRYRSVAAYAGKLVFAGANAIWDAEGARGVYLKNHIARSIGTCAPRPATSLTTGTATGRLTGG